MVNTTAGEPVPDALCSKYFKRLINAFFKILPIRENEEDTLPVYVRSLQCEILGCGDLIEGLGCDPDFLRLSATLQYLYDHPETSVREVKREVFKAISICEALEARYEESGCVE